MCSETSLCECVYTVINHIVATQIGYMTSGDKFGHLFILGLMLLVLFVIGLQLRHV